MNNLEWITKIAKLFLSPVDRLIKRLSQRYDNTMELPKSQILTWNKSEVPLSGDLLKNTDNNWIKEISKNPEETF